MKLTDNLMQQAPICFNYDIGGVNMNYITMLKGKLHRVKVTATELDYEGSCAIDSGLLKLSEIRPHEQIHIFNVNNGERFITYAIEAPQGSGVISLNGAAARLAAVGDLLIIAAFAQVPEGEADSFHPLVTYVDDNNQPLTN